MHLLIIKNPMLSFVLKVISREMGQYRENELKLL